ncbi:MAG TPA: ATP-dependent helicase [Anaerolineaceae bacterium]|nr:ATP-dependent helicase [Anaerolineaceae bacterium]
MAGFKPRDAQKKILEYRGGRMGVSAVPGSGKTQTLSYLAASLIREGYVTEDQEVLIVTLVNSAVENFSTRIAGFIQEAGLLVGFGYRVRTLHGLAHDIVRERPDLAGLEAHFQIADEAECAGILNEVVQSWNGAHPEFIEIWSNPEYTPSGQFNPRKAWPELVADLGNVFIRQCKDLRLTPVDVHALLDQLQNIPILLQMGYEIYTAYQRALNYRNAVDFDDLIRLALLVLESDPDYLKRLQIRWPYILEDEAQDSSRLQETILRKLSGEGENIAMAQSGWVRVGDPNQAIFETFTTASPDFLINFLREPGVKNCPMPNSGRSALSIIALANQLIRWSQFTDLPALQNALVEPMIKPTPRGDPQPNPPDSPKAVTLVDKAYQSEQETDLVTRFAIQWIKEHPQNTCVILVTRNTHGSKVIEALRAQGEEPVELLRNTFSTRQSAEALATILQYLADPSIPAKLARVYRSLYMPTERGKTPAKEQVHQVARLIEKCRYLETYLWPFPGSDWLASLQQQNHSDGQPATVKHLAEFRELILRWQQATLLPVDQLLLTIAQDLYDSPADLALAHKLALLLERAASAHSDWHLEEFAGELDAIARAERKLSGFSEDDLGFNPDAHPGQIVVATVHKAKGLEWDKVYLVSTNSYDFPAALPDDTFISEKAFVRGRLNLEAELLHQLNAAQQEKTRFELYLEPGEATVQARREYARERLRLLYVAITRARRELSITWNTGRGGRYQANQALRALIDSRTAQEPSIEEEN